MELYPEHDLKITGPIIIVDDDQDDHDLLKDLCNTLGICDSLRFFYDGDAALKYIKTVKERPFIVLCDINMPQMSGLQLRRDMLEDKELRRRSIPFVFFSTAASESQIREAYEDLVVQGFFLKEQSFVELQNTLRIILEYWSKSKYPMD